MERDGSGIADFSSRGSLDNNFTWPDFGAPGVSIWATEARKTLISAMRKQSSEDQSDAYYMAISGTSMATPHVSGVVALMWQAAPSMRVSEIHDDSMDNGTEYWNSTDTRIHEVEWILKSTSRYINASGDNGVPDNSSIGLDDNPYDFAQGYGIVQVDKAIGVALTLEELRVQDPDATVSDALQVYEYTMIKNYTGRRTNRLQDNWFGDWSRLNDGNQNVFTKTTHDVMIPNGTRDVDIVLNYNPAHSDGWTISELTVMIDMDGDGSSDWDGGNAYSSHGYKEWNVPASGSGTWSFNVMGQAAQIPDWWRNRNPGDNEFNEVTIEYTIGIFLNIDVPEDGNVSLDDWDLHARNGILDWAEPSEDMAGNESDCQGCTHEIVMETYWYDLRLARLPEEPPKKPEAKRELPCVPLAAVAIIAVVVIGMYYMKTKQMGPFGGKGLLPKKIIKGKTAKKDK
jgi:hypothetical protein